MDMTTFLLLVLALLFLIVLLGFSRSIVMFAEKFPALKKKAKDYRYKERLRRVVYRYRLSKMLHYIGIRVEDYVDRIPSSEVKKQIMTCKRCTNINTCDLCLRDGMFVNDMHFCPNYKSLMTFSKIMPPVE